MVLPEHQCRAPGGVAERGDACQRSKVRGSDDRERAAHLLWSDRSTRAPRSGGSVFFSDLCPLNSDTWYRVPPARAPHPGPPPAMTSGCS